MTDPACICDFPATCDGSGILRCEGCGGEFCVCKSCEGNGEIECPGCEECEEKYDEDYQDEED